MTQTPVYIRHRDRMVQESVFDDLVNTLIACRWLAGTTSRPVVDPTVPPAFDDSGRRVRSVLTTTADQVLKIVGEYPITLVDYFPESTSDELAVAGDPDSGQTEPNTLALDDGQAGDPTPIEMGSNAVEVPYRFTVAFWASNVGVAQALLNDLRDRYQGRIVEGSVIPLYDYNVDPTTPAVWMEVNDFQYLRDVEDSAAPHEVTMFYGQLTLTDYVD